MPFHPAGPLPRFIPDLHRFGRGVYELERGVNQGRELHYVDHGDRDAFAVVMIHGNPTWSFLWRKVIAALPHRRCIAPDLLGFGLSSRLPRIADHSLPVHTEALCELLDALELPSFVLVGQDWGGPIAMAVGSRMSARVRGFVLGNTSVLVPKHPRGTAFHRLARLPVVSDVLFRGLGLPQRLLGTVQGSRAAARSIQGGDVGRAYRWPLRRFSDRVGPLALARMVPNASHHPSMAPLAEASRWATSFTGPKALVWGTRDPLLGRALPRHQRAFPDAPVTVTSAGHFLQEEVPEAIADAIEDVIARATDPRAS